MKTRVFQRYHTFLATARQRSLRFVAVAGIMAGACLLSSTSSFGQGRGGSGSAGMNDVGTGGQTDGGNLGIGGRVRGGTRSGAVSGGTRSGAVRGGTRSGAVGGEDTGSFDRQRFSDGSRGVNRYGDTLSERGSGRDTSDRYADDRPSLSERGAGWTRNDDRRSARSYNRNTGRYDRDPRTLRGETVFSGGRDALVDDDRGVGYDYPGAGRRYYAGRTTVPRDVAVTRETRASFPDGRGGVVYDDVGDRGVVDRDFSAGGPFDYNFPRRRNVGRDRELSDERYYDRYEFPDRYRGTTVPDPVRQGEYIPDYLPEYRRDDLIRAGRRVTAGTVNTFDPPHRDPEFLDYRGGGRLGRGPTGISDPEFMGAGGRDTAGRRRGVSGQSGAFGHRDRGVIVGDQPDFYGGYEGMGEVIDD